MDIKTYVAFFLKIGKMSASVTSFCETNASIKQQNEQRNTFATGKRSIS
ncbi:hypothetical protein [Clostridium sp.]